MNLPIYVRHRLSAFLKEEGCYASLIRAYSEIRVSRAMRMSLTSGGLMVAKRKL